MKNAITMPNRHQWRNCASIQGLAHMLLCEVLLEGRKIKEHGRIAIEESLVYPEEQFDEESIVEVTWLLIDEGLLLVRWPFDPRLSGYQWMYPSALWIPDIETDRSPLVKSCLKNISAAIIGRVTEGFEKRRVKQKVNLRVDSVLLLQNDFNLYAFPLDETPEKYLLNDVMSEKLCALGIKFVEEGYTGYLELYYCDLFVQGPEWHFSRFPWLKREPVLSTKAYAYLVLVAGEADDALSCDGSERRDCLFCEQFAGATIDVFVRLVYRTAHTGDWSYETYFNPREVWESAMKDWDIFLAHDDWEGVYETLCKPDYENHTVDTSWLYLINDCYRADYPMTKEVITYLYQWVEQVLETEEGITVYYIL